MSSEQAKFDVVMTKAQSRYGRGRYEDARSLYSLASESDVPRQLRPTDIPRALRALQTRCWMFGVGYRELRFGVSVGCRASTA